MQAFVNIFWQSRRSTVTPNSMTSTSPNDRCVHRSERRRDVRRHGPVRANQRVFSQDFHVLRNGPASHDTFSRVFRLLAPDQFRTCFIAFMQRFAEGCEVSQQGGGLKLEVVRKNRAGHPSMGTNLHAGSQSKSSNRDSHQDVSGMSIRDSRAG